MMKTEPVFGALADWLIYARSWTDDDSWRGRCLAVMVPVVEAEIERVKGDELLIDVGEFRKFVSKEYPFGARKNYPYKTWLTESRVLFTAMLDGGPLSHEEYGAVMVALDLLLLGKPDEALALLESDAPNRLGRKCKACGASRGSPCREDGHADLPLFGGAGAFGRTISTPRRFVELLIPHESRLLPKKEPNQ